MSWSYGSWIYNYQCNQCLSPLTLWVRIPPRQGVLDTTLCDQVYRWLAVGRWFSAGTPVSSTKKNWLPLYSWNIVESGIEYHNPNSMFCDKNKMIDIYFTSGINSLDLRLNSVTLEILYYLKLFFSPFFFSLLRPRKWHQKQIQQIVSYDGADQSRSLMWKVGYCSLLWRHSDDNWRNGDILMC